MKRVVGTALMSLSFVVGPALVERAGLGAFESEAFAQPAPPPAPADAVTEVARQRYKEGVKAYEAGKFEDARAAFLQAYALKRVPAVLLNLGQSELRTQPPHTEEAGNHLQQFLREHTAATPEERAAAEKGIADVKKKSGLVAVAVDAPGADIAIDGTVVGKSPMADPVFVKPGKHVVSATLGGKTANDAFDAQVGATKQISLTVGAAAPPVAPPVSPPPSPLAPPSPTPELPPPGTNPQPNPTPEPTDGQTFGQWYGKKPLAWVTTGVAGVGLVGGVIFSIVAASASSTTNSAADQIRQHLATHPVPNGTPCAPDGSGQADAMGYETACQTLRDDIGAYHTDVALAATGWVLFGVGGIATVTYAMVDWYPHRKKGSAPTTGDIKVVPVLSPGVQGMTVIGRF